MAKNIIEKITDFFWVEEDTKEIQEIDSPRQRSKAPQLRVQTMRQQADLKVVAVYPINYEDVAVYADYLKAHVSVLINYECVDEATQQSILDFLNGVCYVTNCRVERIAPDMYMYAPAEVDFEKKFDFGYSIPTYVKQVKL